MMCELEQAYKHHSEILPIAYIVVNFERSEIYP